MKKICCILGALIATSTLTTSCDSCDRKTQESDNTEIQTTTNEMPEYVDTAPDTISTVAVNPDSDSEVASGSGSPANSSSSTTAPATKSTTAKTAGRSAASDGKSLKGYGAPDGTDAENHDGDQYTKNNNTPQPSGPPIK